MASSSRRSLVQHCGSQSEEGRELFEACRNGDLSKVKKLVNTSNVNARDTAGRKSSPLHFAAGFGRKDVVEYLLQCGANVHARDDGGLIPLHNACSFGHAEVVQLLLRHGADANARDNWNYTPLHEAAIKGKIDVCTVLLQHGADPSIRNTDGKTALDLADSSAKSVLTGKVLIDLYLHLLVVLIENSLPSVLIHFVVSNGIRIDNKFVQMLLDLYTDNYASIQSVNTAAYLNFCRRVQERRTA